MENERTGFKTTVDMKDIIPRDGKWHTLEVRYEDGIFQYFLGGKKAPEKRLFRDPQIPGAYKEYNVEE